MIKLKRDKYFYLFFSIILLFILLILVYRSFVLEPCSKFITGEYIEYTTPEHNYYTIGLSDEVLFGKGNKEIVVRVSCLNQGYLYSFSRLFDFKNFKYTWITEDSYDGVEINYGSPKTYKDSDNVIFVIPLPKGVECEVITLYSGICG